MTKRKRFVKAMFWSISVSRFCFGVLLEPNAFVWFRLISMSIHFSGARNKYGRTYKLTKTLITFIFSLSWRIHSRRCSQPKMMYDRLTAWAQKILFSKQRRYGNLNSESNVLAVSQFQKSFHLLCTICKQFTNLLIASYTLKIFCCWNWQQQEKIEC